MRGRLIGDRVDKQLEKDRIKQGQRLKQLGLDRKVKGKKGTKNAKGDCKEGLNMGKRKWQRKRRLCKELIKRGRKGKKTRMKIEVRKKVKYEVEEKVHEENGGVCVLSWLKLKELRDFGEGGQKVAPLRVVIDVR